jgi:hypothetical protein
VASEPLNQDCSPSQANVAWASRPEELAGRYPDLIARVLTGLLGPAQPHRRRVFSLHV